MLGSNFFLICISLHRISLIWVQHSIGRNSQMSFYCTDDDAIRMASGRPSNGKWPYGNQTSGKSRLPSATNWLHKLTPGLRTWNLNFTWARPNKALKFSLFFHQLAVAEVRPARAAEGKSFMDFHCFGCCRVKWLRKINKTHRDGH